MKSWKLSLKKWFWHKIKSKAKVKNLRHASLEKNVIETSVKFHYWGANIKRDIHVHMGGGGWGGSPCHIIRNGNVALLILRNGNVTLSIFILSHMRRFCVCSLPTMSTVFCVFLKKNICKEILQGNPLVFQYYTWQKYINRSNNVIDRDISNDNNITLIKVIIVIIITDILAILCSYTLEKRVNKNSYDSISW